MLRNLDAEIKMEIFTKDDDDLSNTIFASSDRKKVFWVGFLFSFCVDFTVTKLDNLRFFYFYPVPHQIL
jgi:hypothetical protein